MPVHSNNTSHQMNTSNNITSYVDCISDESLAELLPVDHCEAILRHIERPSIRGYGTWRLAADLEVNGKRITIVTTTHDEDLKVHFVDQSCWNNMSEPTMTESEAAEAILALLFAANEDEIIDAAENEEDTSA